MKVLGHKKKILFCLSLFFVIFAYIHTVTVFATTVELLAPIPGARDFVDFDTYVPLAFNIAIGIAGVLAVIMIVIAGLQYMSTDAIGGKEDAKSKITAALGGLLLALAAYILLQQINPDLVKFKLPNVEVGVTSSSVGTGGTGGVGTGGTGTGGTGSGGPLMGINQIRASVAGASDHDALIRKYAALYGLPPERIEAMMAIESAGRVTARGAAGELGLMQMKPTTAQAILRKNPALAAEFGITNISDLQQVSAVILNNGEANVAIAMRDYADVAKRTGSLDAAVAYHNGGPDAIAPSVDCPGLAKYQCTTNPGLLAGTQRYIQNVHNMENFIRTGAG